MQQCYFSANNIKQIDYKDIEAVKKFLDPYARILPRKRTKVCAKHQRQLSTAVKRARFMGLIPYVAR